MYNCPAALRFLLTVPFVIVMLLGFDFAGFESRLPKLTPRAHTRARASVFVCVCV